MFADDVKLSAINAKGLQRILDLESNWALENGMSLNTTKSVLIWTVDTHMLEFMSAGSSLKTVRLLPLAEEGVSGTSGY